MNVRKLGYALAVAVAAVGLQASSAAAGEAKPTTDAIGFGGYLGLDAGVRSVQASDDPDDNIHFTFGGQGAANVPLGGPFSTQLDLQGEYYNDTHSGAAFGAGMLGAHVSVRDPNLGLVGLFGGGGLGSSSDQEDNGGLGFVAGGEVAGYLGPVTLYGQAGYGEFDVEEKEGFVQGWFVRGVGKVFPTDDSMIEAEVSHGQTPHFIDGEDDGVIWNWGLRGMMRLCFKYPIYATLAYRGGHYDSTSEGDHLIEHSGLAGFTFLFGAPNLKANDRSFAGLSLPMLPVRTASNTEALD
jgi:opacity protein-like surface antigen